MDFGSNSKLSKHLINKLFCFVQSKFEGFCDLFGNFWWSESPIPIRKIWWSDQCCTGYLIELYHIMAIPYVIFENMSCNMYKHMTFNVVTKFKLFQWRGFFSTFNTLEFDSATLTPKDRLTLFNRFFGMQEYLQLKYTLLQLIFERLCRCVFG